jgi:hypothetical protein
VSSPSPLMRRRIAGGGGTGRERVAWRSEVGRRGAARSDAAFNTKAVETDDCPAARWHPKVGISRSHQPCGLSLDLDKFSP